MVYYRKYRPQKISELDSEEIREKLFSVFSKDSPHAFLFTGSKGLGKTSTARIIAKVVNCERKLKTKNQKEEDQIEPCNKCSQCVSITNGSNLDVLEIDGASNRGIDEIRDLREKIRLSPLSSTKKVYIIDEVHMLTTEAFNALLKTLEEPPNHAIFILCTTESHKVPETILSRCFHISFRKATDGELVNSLTRIAKGEKLNIEPDALIQIAKLADGGFRDGAKILEEMVFLSKGEPVTKEFIDNKYQIANIKYQIVKMINFLSENNTKSALQLVSELTKQGVDIKYFIQQMINVLHEELLMKVGVEQDSGSKIKDQKLTIQKIKMLVELLTKAYGELKFAVIQQLPLELVIIDYTFRDGNQNVSLQPSSVPSSTKHTYEIEKRKEEIKNSLVSLSDKTEDLNMNNNDKSWSNFIAKVKVYNHSIAGVLRGCSLGEISDKQLVIKAGYKFHKERLEEKKTLELLEKAWEELVGKQTKIVVELKK